MTTILKSDIIAKIRRAIDDILPEATDSFTVNTDSELWQAVQHAVEQLLLEMPAEALIPQDGSALTTSSNGDGSGYIVLPDTFLRFICLKLGTWVSPVYTLIEPGSDEEMRQRSLWGRGTPEKPKAMLDTKSVSSSIKNILRFWSIEKTGTPPIYAPTIEIFNYIPMPTVTDEVVDPQTHQVTTPASIECALKDVAVKAVIYRAASIFFEGKKEPETADKFRNI